MVQPADGRWLALERWDGERDRLRRSGILRVVAERDPGGLIPVRDDLVPLVDQQAGQRSDEPVGAGQRTAKQGKGDDALAQVTIQRQDHPPLTRHVRELGDTEHGPAQPPPAPPLATPVPPPAPRRPPPSRASRTRSARGRAGPGRVARSARGGPHRTPCPSGRRPPRRPPVDGRAQRSPPERAVAPTPAGSKPRPRSRSPHAACRRAARGPMPGRRGGCRAGRGRGAACAASARAS